METSATNCKIILNFGWQGPSSKSGGWAKGGLEVGVVDLKIKDAKTEISVHIPDHISPTTIYPLSFTCRRYHEQEVELKGSRFKPLKSETHPASLILTVEQIHNLTLNAGFFEESPRKGPKIMDIKTGQITQEKYALRTDRSVNFEIPDKLEEGQTYRLVVVSDDLSLSAKLVKEEAVKETKKPDPKEAAQLIEDQKEIKLFMSAALLMLMGMKVLEFSMSLATISSDTLQVNSQNTTAGIQAIEKEILKMKKEDAQELANKIRFAKAQSSNMNKTQLEKDVMKQYLKMMGPRSFANMMRANLEGLLSGTIPFEVKNKIEQIAARFQENCLNYLNK